MKHMSHSHMKPSFILTGEPAGSEIQNNIAKQNKLAKSQEHNLTFSVTDRFHIYDLSRNSSPETYGHVSI